jgi:cell division transport system permease protein
MNRITFYRILENGVLNYWRNFWLSVAATVIMVITLFIISTLLLLNTLANISLSTLKDKVDISVYFNLSISEQTIKQIQRQVELLPEIKSLDYIPPVTARERFKQLHKDEPLLLESVEQFSDQENPFPASFAIRVKNLEDYPKIISLFQDQKFDPFIKKITDKRQIVERLNRITKVIRDLGLSLTGVFSLITIIVMFNTVRLTIYNRREEIEIMRLVGASNWFIRGPYLIEGIFYGVAGTLITAVLLFPIVYVLTPKISGFLELDMSRGNYLLLNFWPLVGLQLLIGVLLGIVSSFIAVRKYLKT